MKQVKKTQRIKRIYLSRKRTLMFLCVIAAVGIFMLFMHAVFVPVDIVTESEIKEPIEQTDISPPEKIAEKSDTAKTVEKPPVTPPSPPAVSGKKQEDSAEPIPSADKGLVKEKGSAGVLIFVIDDAGYNMHQTEAFLRLPFPISIAVLPALEYSVQTAQKIREAGKEVLLHQPMQAQNRNLDPGPNAIQENMSNEEIRRILQENVKSIGPIAGINNHEGSLITANAQAMGAVLEFCKENHVYFLDSRTTAESQGASEAKKRAIQIWERAVFLDNSKDRKSIENAVCDGMKIASSKGAAIMIGHVWSTELAQILSDMYPEMVEQGYSLSTISEFAVMDGMYNENSRY